LKFVVFESYVLNKGIDRQIDGYGYIDSAVYDHDDHEYIYYIDSSTPPFARYELFS